MTDGDQVHSIEYCWPWRKITRSDQVDPFAEPGNSYRTLLAYSRLILEGWP